MNSNQHLGLFNTEMSRCDEDEGVRVSPTRSIRRNLIFAKRPGPISMDLAMNIGGGQLVLGFGHDRILHSIEALLPRRNLRTTETIALPSLSEMSCLRFPGISGRHIVDMDAEVMMYRDPDVAWIGLPDIIALFPSSPTYCALSPTVIVELRDDVFCGTFLLLEGVA